MTTCVLPKHGRQPGADLLDAVVPEGSGRRRRTAPASQASATGGATAGRSAGLTPGKEPERAWQPRRRSVEGARSTQTRAKAEEDPENAIATAPTTATQVSPNARSGGALGSRAMLQRLLVIARGKAAPL
jgi:hypothetical protein